MRDPARIKAMLKEIETLWNKFPDQRLGQLLFNYTRFGTRTKYAGTIRDPFFYDDADILKDLEKANKRTRRRDVVKRKRKEQEEGANFFTILGVACGVAAGWFAAMVAADLGPGAVVVVAGAGVAVIAAVMSWLFSKMEEREVGVRRGR